MNRGRGSGFKIRVRAIWQGRGATFPFASGVRVKSSLGPKRIDRRHLPPPNVVGDWLRGDPEGTLEVNSGPLEVNSGPLAGAPLMSVFGNSVRGLRGPRLRSEDLSERI